MKYPRYVRNDAIIRAVQWFPDVLISEVTLNKLGEPFVYTPRGALKVLPGDWIVISEHQIAVCPPEHFETVFHPVCRSTTDKK